MRNPFLGLLGAMTLFLLIGLIIGVTIPYSPLEATTDDQTQSKEALYTFDDLLDAIWSVESECGLNSVPGQDGEIGDYQLKEIYIDDCNRILKLNGELKRVTYDDRYSPAESRKITAYVISHYANNDWSDKPHTRMQWLETAARAHNSPANRNNSKTDAYWALILDAMKSQKGIK